MSASDGSPAPPDASPRGEGLLPRFALQYLTVAWVRGLSILAVFVYARFLPERELGAFFLAAAAFEVAAVLTDWGLSAYATARLAENAPDAQRTLAAAPRIRLAGTALYLLTLGIAWLAWGYAKAGPMLVLGAALVPYALVQNARAYWQGRRRIRALQGASAAANTVGPVAAMLAASAGAGAGEVAAAFSLSFWAEWLLTLRWCRPEADRQADRRYWSPAALLRPAAASACGAGHATEEPGDSIAAERPVSSEPERGADGKGALDLLRRALPFGLFTMVWFAYLRMDVFLVEAWAPHRLASYGLCLKLYTAALSFLYGGLLVTLSDSRRIETVWRRPPLPGPHLFLIALVVIQSAAIWGPKALLALLPETYSGIEIPCRTLVYSGVAHAGLLVLGAVGLGSGRRTGRALWAVLLLAGAVVFALGRLETHFLGAYWPAWNRISADLLAFLLILFLHLRERPDALEAPPRA